MRSVTTPLRRDTRARRRMTLAAGSVVRRSAPPAAGDPPPPPEPAAGRRAFGTVAGVMGSRPLEVAAVVGGAARAASPRSRGGVHV